MEAETERRIKGREGINKNSTIYVKGCLSLSGKRVFEGEKYSQESFLPLFFGY